MTSIRKIRRRAGRRPSWSAPRHWEAALRRLRELHDNHELTCWPRVTVLHSEWAYDLRHPSPDLLAACASGELLDGEFLVLDDAIVPAVARATSDAFRTGIGRLELDGCEILTISAGSPKPPAWVRDED